MVVGSKSREPSSPSVPAPPSSSFSLRRGFSFHHKRSKSLPLPKASSPPADRKRADDGDDDDDATRNNNTKKSVSFGDNNNNNNNTNVAVSVVEFSNPEYCSLDPKVRKTIWYSSLEIRSIKQANMDLVRQRQDEEEKAKQGGKKCHHHDNHHQLKQHEEKDYYGGSSCWRGLEHLIEGEMKRRQRIREFVLSICKVQQEYKRKKGGGRGGGEGEAKIADAISQFCRSQSKSDRKLAVKVGRLDASEVGNERSEFSSCQKNDGHNAAAPLAHIIRPKSSHSFHKRRTLMRRFSFSGGASLIAASLKSNSMGSSSRSLQSTSSTASADSNGSFVNS